MLGVRHPWVKQRPNPAHPNVLDNFRLYAVLGTWMEADVVAATVQNAFLQGCERIFLVDNSSPDDTVAVAVGAGAELADSYSVERHDEHQRVRRMNDVVARVSSETDVDHVWWLWLDADEFPHGPRGLTLLEYLRTLDSRFRIVGGRFFNHYPGSSEPHYVEGFHPLDFQPLCEELRSCMCWANHRKHPLHRFDRKGAPIRSGIGFHQAASKDKPLWEPNEPIFIHHFPFRERSMTEKRLAALVDGRLQLKTRLYDHMLVRAKTVDAVYANDWVKVGRYVSPDAVRPHLEPRPWTELVPAEDAPVKRWYS